MFKAVGINVSENFLTSEEGLRLELESLKETGADFVEVCPHNLGIILGGRLDEGRTEAVAQTLEAAGIGCTVHAPHRMNLMDLDGLNLQRSVLEASIRFAARIGAEVVVCHAGQRVNARDARHSLTGQMAAEREALRRVGELAGNLDVTIAIENSYPEPPIVSGAVYAYAAWPSELAGQVAAAGHPAVRMCLDVGHAAVASSYFGFDYLAECAAAARVVRHVHLHDNLGRPDLREGGEIKISERHAYGVGDLHLPPGRGKLPLEELMRRARFDGETTCCVELSPGLRPLASEAVESARALAAKAAVGAGRT